MTDAGAPLNRLQAIMAKLRAKGGCPWDRQQDIRTLRPYLLEEAHEVLDEMDKVAQGQPWRPLCEELGDLLFQIVFHSQLASELNEFTLADVCNAISDKIERRHPHVFGEQKVEGAEQVLSNWAKLKAEERRKKTGREGSVLDGVPHSAPSLLRAERLTEKASRIGFDWPNLASVRAKLAEELGELSEAISSKERAAIEHELGDVFFALANVARFLGVPPEDAVRAANGRFTSRFHQVEAALQKAGIPFGQATLEEMDRHWNEAKAQEKASPPAVHLPRADVSSVELSVENLSAQQALWDALVPLLGWQKQPSEPGRLRYGSGAWEVTFVGGPKSSAAFWIAAPSREAVLKFFKQIQPLGCKASPPEEMERALGKRCLATQFIDAGSYVWRYAF